ncbi:uncharacterized protein LOC131312789 [Rhododendron vialii]|uniref:uncharacterized protein LOC131312789 n=1 Tax=Rhododendron vialii TaxID=182163 RepID=UPI00265E395F|nr:uncharacterized protein LOC131312789 [Rhododendron vialii]
MASTLILVVVFVIDLVAFALAVAAEQRRAKASTKVNSSNEPYCAYGSDIATGLGVGSLLTLMASQIIIMAVSRCMCCGKALRPGSSRAWAIALFITCWVTFIIAELCLLAGSVRNAYHTKSALSANNPPSCETLRKGVFGAGAAFIVFTGIVSELYYVYYTKANDGFQPNIDTGIRMGTYK